MHAKHIFLALLNDTDVITHHEPHFIQLNHLSLSPPLDSGLANSHLHPKLTLAPTKD